MKNPLLDRTIIRTVHALRAVSFKEIRQLPALDSALLLEAVCDMTDLAELRSELVERARYRLRPDWIREGDLLEVFLTFNALWKHNSSYITGDQLASAVERLIHCEASVGGPYYSGSTIEIAANLQVSSFTHRVAMPLPDVEAFLNQAVVAGDFAEAAKDQPYLFYLASEAPDCYKILQSCAEKCTPIPLYKAAILTTLHNPFEAKGIVDSLCREQQTTGLWDKGSPSKDFLSSDLIASAIIGSILTRHRRRLVAPSQLSVRHQEVVKTAKQLLCTHAEPLRASTLIAINNVSLVDKEHEITLLPYLFIRSLPANTTRLSESQCNLLGAANLYGWIAYTIYDDFLDHEGVPERLPVANCAMRYALDCFQKAMPTHHRYQEYVSAVFTKMDAANAWELAHCRFVVHDNKVVITQLPRYRQCAALASRSFAHVLGPMAIIIHHGSSQRNIDRVESAFRHYLVARQLADDLYDWIDDMKAGRVSYVVTAILRDMQLSPGEYSLDSLLPIMQKTFRRITMIRVCSLALRHIRTARQQFIQNGLIQTTDDIFTLLDTLEQVLEHSADEHAKVTAFARESA